MEKIISVDHISKSYGKSIVVDGVSFDVYKGEILGLLGPNGAGKSTIIRCILGIKEQDSGTIHYVFDKLQGMNNGKLGYLPEERGLYKDSKIMDILLYIAELKNYPREKARTRVFEYLEKFDLQGKHNMKVKELSKGMAQKVQFIASVIHEPELLILDEPLSGLDPVSQDLIIEEIKLLASHGTTILLSSHQMNMVESLCSRIFMMNKGRQVLYGNLEEIKEQHGNFKCEILGNNSLLHFPPLPFIEKIERDGMKTTFHLKKETPIHRFLESIPVQADIKELHIDRVSLHDIFVKMVTGGENS